MGVAMANNNELVDALIEQGASLNSAVIGAALGKHHDLV